MIKKIIKPYFLEIVISCIILLLAVSGYFFSMYVLQKDEPLDITYVSYEVLTDNVYPVINDTTNNNLLIKPFNEDGITVAKSYYDYKKENNDESITFYEDTYLQNTGIDYARETPFNILAILDGKIISITDNDITGKTVKIEHSNMISIYQSINNISVNEGDTVKKGQIIGTSGTNEINSDLGNHLHFELYVNEKLVNPDNYFNKIVGE